MSQILKNSTVIRAQPIKRLLIVGNSLPFHIGAHFLRAAHWLGIEAQIIDVQQAYKAPRPVRWLFWRLADHRPLHLKNFSRMILQLCKDWQPQLLLATGIAPLSRSALAEIQNLGIMTTNYLTDDPWNPAHKATWFLNALPYYQYVFSPRRANLTDLASIGCKSFYLPFAYDPIVHQRINLSHQDKKAIASQVLFAGGADPDRAPIMHRLIDKGFDVALYGGYWDKFDIDKRHIRGQADLPTLCKAIAAADVSLCLVRRANRDGHVMRTFEVPAMGGCMLVEDTVEHREIFGNEGETVHFFSTEDELIEKLEWLLARDQERTRLADAVHTHITHGHHTYADRLQSILDCLE